MKQVLLDTHAFLWWTQDDHRLTASARHAIATSDCRFSLASCWELAIKASLGRINFDRPLAQFLAEQLASAGFSLLPINFRHVMRVGQLPFHHRDPFDRLLAAQTIEEHLTLVSADEVFDAYKVSRIW